MRTNPYLQLIRPANLITSATDIVAGATLATLLTHPPTEASFSLIHFCLLVISTVFLYAGGIAFNDVFDHHIDRIERPERPIPSGRISMVQAGRFAGILLLAGILSGFLVHPLSGILALFIAVLSLVYNKISKHHALGGPLNMGILRGLNLLLGLSMIPSVVHHHYWIAIIPVIYIFAITMVSRGEVHGSSVRTLILALGLYIIADTAILSYGFRYDRIWLPLLFVFMHLLFVLPPLFKAIKEPIPDFIRQAVKHGVIGVILLDAIWVSMTDYWYWAFVLLLLLPLSKKLGKYFSVT